MSKEKNICNCGCEEGYECSCDKKDLALKIGVGIASLALIGGVIAAVVLKTKKDN